MTKRLRIVKMKVMRHLVVVLLLTSVILQFDMVLPFYFLTWSLDLFEKVLIQVLDWIDSGFNDRADISTEAKILHKLTLNKIFKKTKLLQHLKPAKLNLP